MNSHPVDFQEAGRILSRKGHKLFTSVGPRGFQCLVDDTYSYTADEIVFLAKSGRPPGTKIWRQIICSEKITAEALMIQVHRAHGETGAPTGVEIYYDQRDDTRAYYFSPEATQLLPESLSTYTVNLCFKPTISNLQKMQL